jgi:hypothetical protein
MGEEGIKSVKMLTARENIEVYAMFRDLLHIG